MSPLLRFSLWWEDKGKAVRFNHGCFGAFLWDCFWILGPVCLFVAGVMLTIAKGISLGWLPSSCR